MPYHPSVLWFEASLSELRKGSSEAVESVARISLPFALQSQVVSKHNPAFRESGGTKMLYVDLKAAVVEEYGVVADTDACTKVQFLCMVGNAGTNSLLFRFSYCPHFSLMAASRVPQYTFGNKISIQCPVCKLIDV